MKRGFTITELLVAMGLMVVIMAVSGTVFRSAIESERTAEAIAEITKRLRAIKTQLDEDFRGLRRDGQIFIAWIAYAVTDADGNPIDSDGDGVPDEYERDDRIVFFSGGYLEPSFESFYEWPVFGSVADQRITGNRARVSYMLARPDQDPWGRVLARSQHVLTTAVVRDDDLVPPGPPLFSYLVNIPIPFTQADSQDWEMWNNTYEHENESLATWINASIAQKQEMLGVCSGVIVDINQPSGRLSFSVRGGLTIDVEADETVFPLDRANPPEKNIHMLVSQGVGQFSVQGWYDAEQRWFPEIDPNRDGDLSDTDFILDGSVINESLFPGLLYPDPGGFHESGPDPLDSQYAGPLDEVNFDNIPGLGRALKFTFTLYDSKRIFKDGKTFTHIVYLR